MPIVIHEFEIVPESPQPRPPETPHEPGEAADSLRPEDVVRVMRAERDRLARVRAT